MTIWKYRVPIQDRFLLMMPAGAVVLKVDIQRGEPYLWALVNESMPAMDDRAFRLLGTGQPADDVNPRNYVGTFQMYAGLVFHLFEEGSPRRP